MPFEVTDMETCQKQSNIKEAELLSMEMKQQHMQSDILRLRNELSSTRSLLSSQQSLHKEAAYKHNLATMPGSSSSVVILRPADGREPPLSKAEACIFRRYFDEIDSEQVDGYITRHELETYLNKRLRLKVSDSELSAMMAEADIGVKDNQIDFDEFVSIIRAAEMFKALPKWRAIQQKVGEEIDKLHENGDIFIEPKLDYIRDQSWLPATKREKDSTTTKAKKTTTKKKEKGGGGKPAVAAAAAAKNGSKAKFEKPSLPAVSKKKGGKESGSSGRVTAAAATKTGGKKTLPQRK